MGLRRRVCHPPLRSSNLGTDFSFDSEEISSFSGQPDVIAYVATVQPKPGIFIDEISHLLVLCTPTSVLLIGVSVSPVTGQDGGAHKEIRMYATDMSASTDVEMTSVVDTADRRIFMCDSQVGCLYELHYQGKEGWFGKRVQATNNSIGGVQTLFPKLMRKSDGAQVLVTYFGRADPRIDHVTSVVVDKKRHVLYTLSSSSTISAHRKSGDKAVQHLQTPSNVYKLVQDKALSSPALSLKGFSVVSIRVIDPVESCDHIQLHLMVITTNGVRLFFSPQASLEGYGHSSAPEAYTAPGFHHVRLPPTNPVHPQVTNSYALVQAKPSPAASRPHILSTIRSALYIVGLTTATQQGGVNTLNYILLLSLDLPKIGPFGQPQQSPTKQLASYQTFTYPEYADSQRPPLTGQTTLLPIPGRTWAMCQTPRDPHDEVYMCHARSGRHERTRLPIYGVDPGVHRDEKRRIVILSEEVSHRCIEGCSRRSDGWEHGFDRSFPGQASRAHFRIGLIMT
jgi:nuclear pore complex protein Nup155